MRPTVENTSKRVSRTKRASNANCPWFSPGASRLQFKTHIHPLNCFGSTYLAQSCSAQISEIWKCFLLESIREAISFVKPKVHECANGDCSSGNTVCISFLDNCEDATLKVKINTYSQTSIGEKSQPAKIYKTLYGA